MAIKNESVMTIRLPKELLDAIKAAADEEGLTVAAWIRVNLKRSLPRVRRSPSSRNG